MTLEVQELKALGAEANHLVAQIEEQFL